MAKSFDNGLDIHEHALVFTKEWPASFIAHSRPDF